MTPVADLMQQGGGASLLFIPTAVVLGALHGLEPGHSKTVMAAFIVAIRGTIAQAVLLGLSATLSHTAVVWGVALGGMYLFSGLDAEATEPYFQVGSAILIILIACCMLYRTWREQHEIGAAKAIGAHAAATRSLMRQVNHHCHDHDSEVELTCAEQQAVETAGAEPMDAHSRAHADEIKKRFASGGATTAQIIMFGLTGGLIPCPAAITVLLLCLQVKQLGIGAALVLAFSVGLALTMVTAGVAASISVKHLSKRFGGFGAFASRAPYFSSIVIICVGLYLGFEGLRTLSAAGAI